MKAETLQEAVFLLLSGAPGRQKRIAGLMNVDQSTVSRWADEDHKSFLSAVWMLERAIGEFPVTRFLAEDPRYKEWKARMEKADKNRLQGAATGTVPGDERA